MHIIDPTLTARLNALQQRYAEYRTHARPRGRVPEDLRTATLELVDAGLKPGVVEKSCCLQWGQLKRWRERRIARMGSRSTRILEVVDGNASAPMETARVTVEGKRLVLEFPL